MPVAAQRAGGLIVGEEEDDVRTFRSMGDAGDEEREKKKAHGWGHGSRLKRPNSTQIPANPVSDPANAR